LGFPNADWVFEAPRKSEDPDASVEFINIGEALPNLRELTLLNLSRTRGGLLKAMPPALERLTIFSEGSSMPAEWVSCLPPSLKYIEGICSTLHSTYEVSTAMICPQLEHWRVGGAFEASLIRRFPPTLKSIVLNPALPSMLPTINASVRRLPRTLTELELKTHQLSNRWINFLPRSLTYLYLCTSGVKKGEKIELSSSLPSLKRLKLATYTPLSTDSGDGFVLQEIPPSLLHLDIDCNVEWQSLPGSSLVTLNIGPSSPDIPSRTELPPSLRSLRIDLLGARLPSGLQSIALTKLYATTTTLAPGRIKYLPQTLETLHVASWPNLEEAEYLPPSLTELVTVKETDRLKITSHVTATSQPRKSIVTAPLQWPKTLKKLELAGMQNSPLSCFESLVHLPDLHTLFIGGRQDMCDIDIFNFIPPSITSLTLQSKDALTSEHLKHCPPRMRSLDIQSTEYALITDSDLDTLPRGLVRLNLPICPDISENFASFLPPHLPKVSTIINRARITIKGITTQYV
jgi:hypothetical protein